MTRKEKYKEIFDRFDSDNNGLTEKQLIAGEKEILNYPSSILRNELIQEGIISKIDDKYYFNGERTVNNDIENTVCQEETTVEREPILPQTINMSNETWKKCSENAAKFANIQFGKKLEKCREKSIAYKAAYASYGPSTRNTVAFTGSYISDMQNVEKNREKENLKINVINGILQDFLSAEIFDFVNCHRVIKQIRDFYRNEKQIVNYTYGNAQKWVNMAIKYYIICKSCYIFESDKKEWNSFDFTSKPTKIKVDVKRAFDEHPNFRKYRIFAVDSIMIEITTKKPYQVKFKNPNFDATCWSKSNYERQFTIYWEKMEEKLKNNDVRIPFLWELNTWEPRENKDVDGDEITDIREIYFADV